MNLTSTLLKVDLAILSIILGILVIFYNWLHQVQEEAVRSAEERTKIRSNLDFCGKRLDDLENWRASISEIRRAQ